MDRSQLSIMPMQKPATPGEILMNFLRELYHRHSNVKSGQSLAFDVSQTLVEPPSDVHEAEMMMDGHQLLGENVL